MKFFAQFKLSIFERALWLLSILVIFLTSFCSASLDFPSMTASLIGATALIYVAKGAPIGQLLTVVFSLFYGYISYTFHYYGEMLTYLGMSAPIALFAWISWLRNPYQKGRSEVKIRKMTGRNWIFLCLLTVFTTILFGYLLYVLKTPNLFWSTVSVTTSFLAASLTFLRSPYYALAYAANDVVLIVLWIFASLSDLGYLPMVTCFCIFLLNDCYGFYNWKRMQRRQSGNHL